MRPHVPPSNVPPSNVLTSYILTFSLVLSSCSLADVNDNVVEGVDLAELFAPPNGAELQAVESAWSVRDVTPDEFGIAVEEEFVAGSWTGTLRIVWHRIDDVTHYGAVIAPADDRPRPVLVYLHGGDSGVSVDEVRLIYEAIPALRDEFVIVVPSYRSERLIASGQIYASGGVPSPFDGDVDDARALLNATLSLIPQADPEWIAAVGFSRGATVALMMSIRDPRIDAVVEFFGMTDFLGAFVQELVRDALRGDLASLPTIDDLYVDIIKPLRDGRMAMATARQELLIRSPIYFADRLPPLQIHHGLLDIVVPPSESEALIRTMQAIDPSEFEYYLYPNGLHHPLTLAGSADRTVDFLLRVIQSPPL